MQTTEDPVLIPSLQALRSNVVNQDRVERRLVELHQHALPQYTGNVMSHLDEPSIAKLVAVNREERRKNRGNMTTIRRICGAFQSTANMHTA